MMALLLGLGLLSLLYYHALLSLGQVLACISIYPNVSCIGLLEIAEFPHAIKRINPESSGLELLGSPVWGPPTFFDSFLSSS